MKAVQHQRMSYVLFWGFVLAALGYSVLVYLPETKSTQARPPYPVTLRPFVYILAGMALLGAIGIARLKMMSSTTLRQFRKALVLALSFALACCIFGLLLYFVGGPATEFLRFQIATLAVDFGFILPQIMRSSKKELL